MKTLLGALVFLLACGHMQDRTPPAASAEAQPQQSVGREPEKAAEPGGEAAAEHKVDAPPVEPDTIGAFMLDHFVITAWARDSVVDGNIEIIRTPLMALAEYSYESVAPGGWMKGVTQLQAAARLTAQAQTLSAAASGIAAMGRLCGQCHAERGGPDVQYYKSETTRPQTDRFDGRMFRHAWAVERMWEGLTAPSDNAWQAGAAALAQAPSAVPNTRPVLTPEVIQMLTLVRQLGVEATSAESAEAREKLYGELLVTCAQCHRQSPKIEF